MSFDTLHFYQGLTEDYEKLTSFEGYNFYLTYDEVEDEKTKEKKLKNFELRLNDKLIYSDNISTALADEILLTDSFKEKFSSYLNKNNTDAEIINSPIIANSSIVANDKITANEIEVTNFSIANNSKISTLNIINSTIDEAYINGGNISNCNITIGEENSIDINGTIENLPVYSNGNYIYNFNDGNLIVNSIVANDIKIGNKSVVTENSEIQSFSVIQIGNLYLSEKDGQLQITTYQPTTVKS